jgi:hypothetical protein
MSTEAGRLHLLHQPALIVAPTEEAPHPLPRQAGRGTPVCDARRRRLKCYARRDFRPLGEGDGDAGRSGHRVMTNLT